MVIVYNLLKGCCLVSWKLIEGFDMFLDFGLEWGQLVYIVFSEKL